MLKIDLELLLLADDVLEKQLQSSNYTLEHRARENRLAIRTSNSDQADMPIGDAIVRFLNDLLDIKETVSGTQSVLRIGIFYNVSELAYLSIQISQVQLTMLNQFGAAFDIAVYPCSDEPVMSAERSSTI